MQNQKWGKGLVTTNQIWVFALDTDIYTNGISPFSAPEVLGGGPLPHFFFCANLLVRVKLGYTPNFNFLGKPLLEEKYVEGRKEERKKE